MPPQVAGLAIPLLDDDNDLSSEEPSPLSPSRHVDAHRRIYSLPLTGVWCTECNKPAHGLPKELINHVREKENLIKGLMSVVASLKLEKVQWNRLWCFECDEPAHGLSNKTREKLRQGNQTISGKKAIKPEMAVAQRALAVEARLPDVKSPVSPREVGRGNRSPSFNRRHHPKSPTKQTPIAVVPRSDNPNFRSPLLQVGSDVASPSSVAIINRDLVGLKITPSPIPTSPVCVIFYYLCFFVLSEKKSVVKKKKKQKTKKNSFLNHLSYYTMNELHKKTLLIGLRKIEFLLCK